MKKICIAVCSIAALLLVAAIARYPYHWEDVRLGMPRTEVLSILGEDVHTSGWDMKGDHCEARSLFVRWDIWVCYDKSFHTKDIRIDTFLQLDPYNDANTELLFRKMIP